MNISSQLKNKIEETVAFLKQELPKYQKPVFYCSFGKDSQVLLHLLVGNKIVLPIVSYSSPFFPRKYDFARKTASDLDASVFDYPPIRLSMLYGKDGTPALMEEFQTSEVTTVAVPKNIVEYQDGDNEQKFRCGVDLLTRPCSTFAYPWDVALIAHKDCDSDSIYNEVPLHSRVLYRDAGPDGLFPLKEWSHEDVWDYIECFQVPMQENRYDVQNRTELKDKTFNPDWFEMCIRCVDARRHGETVFCPKLKTEIKNVSDKVQTFGQKFDYFGVQEEKA